MTKVEIAAAICEANLNDQREQLINRLREMDATEVFDALFPVAVDAQCHGPAYDAACMLFVAKPACPIPCKNAIQAMLPNWDVSIEEVPWYLAGQFGKEPIRRAIEELTSVAIENEHRARLGTVQYWVDVYFTLTSEEIQEAERRSQRMDG